MISNADLISILEKELCNYPEPRLEEMGIVVRVYDGIAEVFGLSQAMYNELVYFYEGNQGIVLRIDERIVYIALLDPNVYVGEREIVKRSGMPLKIGVSEDMLGRVVNGIGKSHDMLGDIKVDKEMPIERLAPSIIERGPVCRPFETGIMAIDSLIPIGKGQRELLVGGRAVGKTSIITDTILHQKGKNVVCIYVSIGNKQSSTAQLISTLSKKGALDYSIIVEADSSDSALSKFLAPYTATAIGEYFMEQGRDVFIAYDDLGNHAVAYREISLVLRQSPGREAYPGDIFYIHSRLLERSCQLADNLGGGSLTAMPAVGLEGDDLAAYIPTNLISITDGQIVLDSRLFHQGVKPAINTGASVSRVGGAAQTPLIKQMVGTLKLDLARYEELESFAKFGSDLDDHSNKMLDHGRKAIRLLSQRRFATYDLVDQVLALFLLNNGMLGEINYDSVQEFFVQFASFIKESYSELYKQIDLAKKMDKTLAEKLMVIADKFKLLFVSGKE